DEKPERKSKLAPTFSMAALSRAILFLRWRISEKSIKESAFCPTDIMGCKFFIFASPVKKFDRFSAGFRELHFLDAGGVDVDDTWTDPQSGLQIGPHAMVAFFGSGSWHQVEQNFVKADFVRIDFHY